MFVEHNLIKNIKIFTLAFTLTVVLIQLSRFISPLAIIHSSYIFLAWMPLCVMLSILFIFGWRGVVPVLCGMFCTNLWNFHLSFLQTAVMLGSQTFVVLCACAILRWQLGTRWRYGLTSRYVWQRLFWLGLVTPIGIKCSMYLVGSFFDFPLKISTFFGDADAIFTVVDLLSLFTAVLIYNMLFYYLTRMIVSPHFAQILWRRDIAPSLGKEKRAFTLSWLAALSVLLLLLCTPYENDFIAGYLVPVFFIIFTLGVGKLRYPFLNLTWAVSTLCLLNYNQNFLQGVETEYSLAFILAVLISFSVCLLYMVRIYHRSEWLNMGYGAAWGRFDGNQETLQPLLGQLSWLAEQSCAHHHVLALDSREEMVSGQTTKQVLLLNTIRTALDQGDLLLYAQPIRNKEGEGYDEILARLKYDGGIMTPDKFLPLIAQFNLSARFDLQVLESLLKWLATHPCDKKGPRFSVNLMPLTLLQKNIAGRIIRLFKRYHISPQAVILEITEEQAFSNAESSMYNIEQLHKFGFRIAIDDFGTGYANYERLKRLQADIIKIDGVFVKDIVTNTLDAMIVRSITDLAKAKSLSVVAEFVETQQQQALLHKLGVQYLQGYLIGRPQPLAD
ncbi:MASE1 domain-containing protein [Escherichia coli]|nr:MASE1 domain-containing protein [Escherichia coli]